MEKVVTYLLRGGMSPDQIGVVTPYEGQRAHILAALPRSGLLNAALYAEARGFCGPTDVPDYTPCASTGKGRESEASNSHLTSGPCMAFSRRARSA